MEGYMDNYAIITPQAFITILLGCRVSVPFEFKKKWDEFYDLVNKQGYLRQCELGGKLIDVWVRGNWQEFGYNPASLQEHFDDFCKPIEFGFHSYPLITKKY